MNRLADEQSPYLLQHAGNPVDWFPWGEAAFAKARAEQKPIFLSIGYSTCHWCHVMERESFESAEVASLLNDNFVSIKVDREERPDIDRVYMTFVQATTGSGGWPMSVWLTPDLEPFYGGTYFPPSTRWGRPGFTEILEEISRAWRSDREKVSESAAALTDRLRGMERAAAGSRVPGTDALAHTLRQFRETFDARRGGFGDAPKFPRPSELLFLLREHARTGDVDAKEMVLRTLRVIALGGMRDHIGGGFHRYSVDASWRVPHFEKMLYDQAQLVLAYIEGAQVSDDPFYADVAQDTIRYVLREMTDAGGGFYSAEDADSVPPEHAAEAGAHKAEGAFYLWSAGEIDRLLATDAEIFKQRFGVLPDGNAPVDPQQEFTGKNLLYVGRSIDDLARQTGRSTDEIAQVLDAARTRLFEARLERPRPYLDDKVLTAWNGLMIAALARGARLVTALGRSGEGRRFTDAARKAATFIREQMWDETSRTLRRRYRSGRGEIEAYAEDYAYLVFGVLALFEVDPDPRWLEWAVTLQERQDELFWDESDGGWFSTTGRDPSVLLRMKEDYDGAEPTASSVSVLNLVVLSHLFDRPEWRGRVERTLKLFGERLERIGRAVPMMAAALATFAAGLQQIVIVGPERQGLDEIVALRYLPFAIAISVDEGRRRELSKALPWIDGMWPVGDRATAYVCRDFVCHAPVTEPRELAAQL